MAFNISASQLTTPTRVLTKTKYFPVELLGSSLIPNSKYDCYFDGVLVNAFCKPFGKNLGDSIVSDSNGKVKVQFHMAIQYNQKYLTSPNGSPNVSVLQSKKLIQFVNPYGNATNYYIPVILKA